MENEFEVVGKHTIIMNALRSQPVGLRWPRRSLARYASVGLRELREIISELVDSGEVVCQSTKGIWIPENENEMWEGYNALVHPGEVMIKKANKLKDNFFKIKNEKQKTEEPKLPFPEEKHETVSKHDA